MASPLVDELDAPEGFNLMAQTKGL